MKNQKKERRTRRQKRIRKRIFGTKSKPRLSVFRSNKHIYIQAIDDVSQKTLASISNLNLKKEKVGKTETAKKVGKEFGLKLKKMKIKTAVFDRGGRLYHGRVKAIAEGIREEGIIF